MKVYQSVVFPAFYIVFFFFLNIKTMVLLSFHQLICFPSPSPLMFPQTRVVPQILSKIATPYGSLWPGFVMKVSQRQVEIGTLTGKWDV